MGTAERRDSGPFTNPWPFLVAGAGLAVLSSVWLWFFGYPAVPLVVLGLLAAGGAVTIRSSSSAVLGAAALTGVIAAAGMSSEWDSIRMVIMVMSALAGLAALVLLLPRWGRRAVVSLIIVFHFVGIWTATMTVEPSPLLWRELWAHVYRPYLEFLYVNNAYHFYAPEPGPGTLVWFYIKYDDGSSEWFKIPQRGDNPVDLEYQRRLSLSESINQLMPLYVPNDRYAARMRAGHRDGIPLHPDEPNILMQYRPPQPYSKLMLGAYAEHVAHLFPKKPGRQVHSVKIYRVMHQLPSPAALAKGDDPTAPWSYVPYYQGEFTPDGKLMDLNDPYLYWVVPIVRKHRTSGYTVASALGEPEDEAIDYMELHAQMDTSNHDDAAAAPAENNLGAPATAPSTPVNPSGERKRQ
jgi:hypothetical protein